MPHPFPCKLQWRCPQYCPDFQTAATSPRLREAVTQLLVAKKNAGRRNVYVTNLRHFLEPFARFVGDHFLDTITADHIEAWVATGKSAWSRLTMLNRVSTLFSFAVRRGWIRENPCSRVERITIDHRPPAILNPEQSARLLTSAPREIRPWIVLGLFCGLRPSEAEKMDWKAVNMAAQIVIVDASASKVRRRRIVRMNLAALRWLSLDRVEAGPVVSSHSTLRRARRRACATAAIEWSADVLRHTYASMRMADGANAHEVADEMGNSPGILLTHYRELVRREDAQKFWEIAPEPMQEAA